jgi:hypothetical protein
VAFSTAVAAAAATVAVAVGVAAALAAAGVDVAAGDPDDRRPCHPVRTMFGRAPGPSVRRAPRGASTYSTTCEVVNVSVAICANSGIADGRVLLRS